MSTNVVRIHQTTDRYYEDDLEQSFRRESYVLVTEQGAVEGWRTPLPDGAPPAFPSGHFGGIEVHSKTPQFDGQESHPGYCQWTGGTCYVDGSALAYDQIASFFDSPRLVFSVLQGWVEEHLADGAAEQD